MVEEAQTTREEVTGFELIMGPPEEEAQGASGGTSRANAKSTDLS